MLASEMCLSIRAVGKNERLGTLPCNEVAKCCRNPVGDKACVRADDTKGKEVDAKRLWCEINKFRSQNDRGRLKCRSDWPTARCKTLCVLWHRPCCQFVSRRGYELFNSSYTGVHCVSVLSMKHPNGRCVLWSFGVRSVRFCMMYDGRTEGHEQQFFVK